MFNGPDFPQSLDEELFDSWLANGRSQKIGYNYLLIIWDEFEAKYLPFYAQSRNEMLRYELYGNSGGQESLVAVYDLYSESRISITNES